MNFSCDKCQKAYSIADEKVAGRSFRVTCKQCGHVIQVAASGLAPVAPRAAPAPAPPPAPRVAAPPPAPRVAAPPPAPRVAAPPPAPRVAAPPPVAPPPAPGPARAAVPAPSAPPPAPVLPADDPPAAAPPTSLEHQRLESTDQHDLFYASEPTHRPRHTAEWMLQDRKRRPYRYVWLGGAAALVVAGVVAYSLWQVQRSRAWPPEASGKSRYQAPPPVPQQVVMPAETVKAAAPVEAPPVELPPEAPLAQRGAAPPKAVGGRAGFESVGGGAGDSDVRERLRQRNLTIAKKDKRLLDLLDKKQDAAPTRNAAVERTELDTGKGPLDEVAVRQTMAAASNAYASCVTRALKESPSLRVDGKRATMMLTIKPSGVVQSAWIAEAELDKSALGKCLVGAARRMIFPAFSGDAVDVSVPLVLSSTM